MIAMDQPTLRLGSGYPNVSPHLRDEVIFVQRELVRRGYALVPDGEFGEVTKAAVVHFQRKIGLEGLGMVGPKTWRALLGGDTRPVGAGFRPPRPASSEPAPAAQPAEAGGGPSWMKVAKAEAASGVHEVKGRPANRRIVEYHATTTLAAKSDEVAWCSSFVNWVLGKAGIKGTNDARAISWKDWGVKASPKYGAITVIYNPSAKNSRMSRSGNHVAFLVEETPTHFTLLGGNQGDQVKVSSYPKRKWVLKGYRWPAG
jgi:uncharacterized protein (TIGR02594 family)